jgi:hypothetical protein
MFSMRIKVVIAIQSINVFLHVLHCVEKLHLDYVHLIDKQLKFFIDLIDQDRHHELT